MTPEEALSIIDARQDVSDDELHARDVLRELVACAHPRVQCPNCGAVVRTSVWVMRGGLPA